MRKTIFCDIDGCILKHKDTIKEIYNSAPVLLPGVFEKFQEWHEKEYVVIITTARPESMREMTESALKSHCLMYDQLIMGVGCGERVVINDIKPNFPNRPLAVAVNLVRDIGLNEVNL
jgi:hypothetical protein